MVYFGVRANAKHHARVMTGEKASASRLEPSALQGAGFPGYAGADGVNVGLRVASLFPSKRFADGIPLDRRWELLAFARLLPR